jgi:hypothetical protein
MGGNSNAGSWGESVGSNVFTGTCSKHGKQFVGCIIFTMSERVRFLAL